LRAHFHPCSCGCALLLGRLSCACESRAEEGRGWWGAGSGSRTPEASNRAVPRADDDPRAASRGSRVDLAERFFDVEDRVAEIGDDIEALKGLEARIAELGSKVERAMTEARRRAGPDEATVRTWGREEAHAEIVGLTRRVQAVESRPVARSDGGIRSDLADLEQRVAVVEARPASRGTTPAQDPTTKARMDEIERACIRLGRRLCAVEADLNKFALSFAQHVYTEAGGDDEDDEDGEE